MQTLEVLRMNCTSKFHSFSSHCFFFQIVIIFSLSYYSICLTIIIDSDFSFISPTAFKKSSLIQLHCSVRIVGVDSISEEIYLNESTQHIDQPQLTFSVLSFIPNVGPKKIISLLPSKFLQLGPKSHHQRQVNKKNYSSLLYKKHVGVYKNMKTQRDIGLLRFICHLKERKKEGSRGLGLEGEIGNLQN